MINISTELLNSTLEVLTPELTFLEEANLEYVGGGTITNTL